VIVLSTNPIYASSTGTSATQSSTSQESASSGLLDKDAFLKLFTSQLMYQDPMSSSVDTGELINQLAQFSMVEQMFNLSQMVESLQEMQQEQYQQDRLLQAAALVGKTVVAQVDGQEISGTVEGVQVGTDSLELKIDGRYVSLDQVVEISNPAVEEEGSGEASDPA
jgi:flagellar basal-body rod modification protein FlgD